MGEMEALHYPGTTDSKSRDKKLNMKLGNVHSESTVKVCVDFNRKGLFLDFDNNNNLTQKL